MPNFLNQATEKVLSFWKGISFTQRIFVGGLAAILLACFAGFMFWLNKPDYQVLYSNLSPEDANRVVNLLQAEKVSYKLENNGSSVLVPQPQLYDLRIKVAGEGGLVGTGIGFEIFDDVKVGVTDFVQKINYQRALQGELSRTISQFPNVESARVHLVVPQRSLFIEEQQKPSASVVLKLKDLGRKMEPKEVQGIVNMLVMAVEGLDKDRISVTDSLGKPLYFPDEDSLTGLSVTQRDHKLKVEQGLERRINELLTPIMGAGKIIAKVNADLDFSQRTIPRENRRPLRAAQRGNQSGTRQSRLSGRQLPWRRPERSRQQPAGNPRNTHHQLRNQQGRTEHHRPGRRDQPHDRSRGGGRRVRKERSGRIRLYPPPQGRTGPRAHACRQRRRL